MHALRNVPAPSASTSDVLAGLATQLVGIPVYEDRVVRAKALWDAKNGSQPRRAAFDELKALLTAACSGSRRCNYCEDSVADEIEHFRPKDLYPEVCFEWANYLYACGNCNGPKGARFAVFGAADEVIEVGRKPKDAVVPPIVGDFVLLNPRSDDPLAFMLLDLWGPGATFTIVALPGLSPRDAARVDYTRRVLHLDDRAHLVEGRRVSFEALKSALVRVAAARAGLTLEAPSDALAGASQVVRRSPHRFVWEVMRHHRARDPVMTMLFERVPEALAW